jgi:hypothetical protein
MQPNSMETLEYETKAGRKLKFRSVATRGDKYEMNAAMSEGMEIKDGKVIKTNSGHLYPWLIQRFAGKELFDALMSEPADPEEDLIMVFGAYILNHVKGLVPHKDDEHKKKL